jgi:hypothetical protein
MSRVWSELRRPTLIDVSRETLMIPDLDGCTTFEIGRTPNCRPGSEWDSGYDACYQLSHVIGASFRHNDSAAGSVWRL